MFCKLRVGGMLPKFILDIFIFMFCMFCICIFWMF